LEAWTAVQVRILITICCAFLVFPFTGWLLFFVFFLLLLDFVYNRGAADILPCNNLVAKFLFLIFLTMTIVLTFSYFIIVTIYETPVPRGLNISE
jgi:hypothetical protein